MISSHHAGASKSFIAMKLVSTLIFIGPSFGTSHFAYCKSHKKNANLVDYSFTYIKHEQTEFVDAPFVVHILSKTVNDASI